MEVIYSDRDFIWADKNDIRKFNQNAKKYYNDNNYSYLIDRDLVKKINSSCYIRHYDENDLKRKKIEFKLPKGKSRNDYTYQIYYVLSAEFMPALKAGKTIFTAEDQENFVTEGNYQMDYSVISPDGEKLSKNLLALRKVKGSVKLKINNKNVKSGSSKSFIYKDIKSLAEKKKINI